MLKHCRIVAHGVNSCDYHSQKVEDRGKPDFIMSPSSIKQFRKNPHKWFKGFVPPETASMTYGNLLDCLVLSPSLFDSRYYEIPDTYAKLVLRCPQCGSITEAQKCRACKCDRVQVTITENWNSKSETCQALLKLHMEAGKTPIYADQLAKAQLAARTLLEDETISDLIKCSRTQVKIVGEWHDKATGMVIPVQCLVDAEPDKASPFQKSLADLKTTHNAEHEAFLWDAYRRDYHLQAAFDLDMHNMATRTNPNDKYSSEGRVEWNFLVQENFPPFEVGRRQLPEELVEAGRRMYQDALARYARCVKSGKWPGHDAPEQFTIMEMHPKMAYEAMSDKLAADQAEALEDSEGELTP